MLVTLIKLGDKMTLAVFESLPPVHHAKEAFHCFFLGECPAGNLGIPF